MFGKKEEIKPNQVFTALINVAKHLNISPREFLEIMEDDKGAAAYILEAIKVGIDSLGKDRHETHAN